MGELHERGNRNNYVRKLYKKFCLAKCRDFKREFRGIYLHGSAVMGCFNEKKSDIDILIVVKNSIYDEIKRQYMDMVVEMNQYAPKKGIELSIVKKDVCKPFVYPTPFELHFSVAHLEWFKTNPSDYISRMRGVDKDLAAHFTIITNRGKCLYGKEVNDVFEKVGTEF